MRRSTHPASLLLLITLLIVLLSSPFTTSATVQGVPEEGLPPVDQQVAATADQAMMSLAAPLAPPPLPRSCIRGAALDSFAAVICCVSGYVYLNGVPIAGAEVTISVGDRTLTTQTQRGEAGGLPFFAALLSDNLGDSSVLQAKPGDTVTITASADGQSKSVSFIAQEGGQQVDVVLPQRTVESAWTPGEIPSRYSHAMVYDAARQRIVLFGGNSGGGVLNDTWEWDGTNWLRITPAVSPPARHSHAMAYDAARQRVVLFGGFVSSMNYLNDTWEWDGTNWTQRFPVDSPSARSDHDMAYDSARQRTVLYGGSGGVAKIDTWEWDGTNWIVQTPTARPDVYWGHAMAYDAARQRVVVFGGMNGSTYNNDLWEWDGTTWLKLFPMNKPTARRNHSLAYDAVRQRIVLFGGHDTYNNYYDTWEWDGESWHERSAVVRPGSTGGAMAYDVAHQKMMLFTSQSGNMNSETWQWDGTNWERSAPILSPSASTDDSLVYDPRDQKLLLFGGYHRNATWLWDGQSWQRAQPATSPPARDEYGMVYDSARQQLLLFGGSGRNDTWVWDGRTWTELKPASQPSARTEHAMAYDPVRQRIVLFGGTVGLTRLNDTWEWDGTNWTQITPAVSPTARAEHAMVYDPVRQRVVLFGGHSGSLNNDLWEWDGTNWTERTTDVRPLARSNHAMVYDSVRQQIVLFGGRSTRNLNDMWLWDGTNWSQQAQAFSPTARSRHAMAYDPIRQRIILFGGLDGSNTIGLTDTWEWDGTRWRMLLTHPLQRPGAALEYTVNGESLLFGGKTADDQTYLWDGQRMKLQAPTNAPPTARSGHRLARDSDGGQVLLFGGLSNSNNYLDDTWLWESASANWLVQAPATSPTARANYGLTFDPTRNVWLLFGGQDASAYLGDTWEYNGTTWTQRSPATSPPARGKATLTYDPARGRAVLIGGQNSRGLLDDVWEWDGTNWIDVTPTLRLTARSGHAATFDSVRSAVVVAGGTGPSGLLSDTWDWNGDFWRERASVPTLPAMTNLSMTYDPVMDRIVAIGGEGQSSSIEGVWLHRASGSLVRPLPVATINRILPRDARQGVDTIRFEGTGADSDATDVISAYRWMLNGSVITTERSFSRAAADLPVGVHTISFAVQDDEGDWSPTVEQQIIIRDGGGGGYGTQSWTLLIYAAADNNLDPWMGENAALNGMLYRLQKAGPQANVQVAVLYDGPGVNDTRRYTLDAAGNWASVNLIEARMDEPGTLRDFLTWGFTNLPATDHYALAIVDHANGIVGIAQDETSKGENTPTPFLTSLEVRAALIEATDDGARKLDLLFYDACSFGLFENAAIAAGLADFVVASANTAWGIFAYDHYRQMLGHASDPRDAAVKIAQHYATAINAEALPYTIAAFDLGHFAELEAALSALGQSLLNYVQADLEPRRQALRELRSTVQKYDSGQGLPFEPDNEDSYVDVVDLARKLRDGIPDSAVQAAAERVLAVAEPSNQRFVAYTSRASRSFQYVDVYQGGERTYNVQLDNAHGLGLFYPPRSSSNVQSAFINYVEHRLFHITRDNGWTRFIGQGLLPQQGNDPPPLVSDVLMPPFIPPNLGASQRIFLPHVVR
ncbi:Kelch repeat-containing protein [Candidatus Chloroploca asiatica]|uniref:Peptidase C11 clostripain n=1 Tax=Candidatus Chloroploca asiatica TaxID=1506545 RepID=A0A2H3L485_9CHLR|nr:kelch repeat-containing protein [Candidatus Chloroploca asiatica]PDV99609.1 hypothetical protein A9Q02_11725 [Candidatus Chloroploca asiatica]